MCVGAMVLGRIKNLYYATEDLKTGACGSICDLIGHKKLNHRIKVTSGILTDECRAVIQEFFKGKRIANARS